MNEKFTKNAKVVQLTEIPFSPEEEKGLIVKDPYDCPLSIFVSVLSLWHKGNLLANNLNAIFYLPC